MTIVSLGGNIRLHLPKNGTLPVQVFWRGSCACGITMSRSDHTEVAIGWMLAMALHPFLAWRILSPRAGALLVFGYFSMAYLAVLTALAVIG